ncbi:hypothetical protein P3X46_014520 [Hevea brasiliensis]|uniref:RNase H type-1 domain-containing protein n=1 Tax=Hevea brasiliensis TaxID=3981 RepID=A0ABQ9M6X4_HEVBR|nr:hypothetical protein P3X46_014520 [Hevea brasiliensis]
MDWEGARQVAPALATMGAIHGVQSRWFKPQEGVLKCNIDVNVNIAKSSVGFGMVLRDSNGGFVTALTGIAQGLRSAREAEVITIREALAWFKRSQLSRVLVETDSQEVAFAFQSAEEERIEFGAIV